MNVMVHRYGDIGFSVSRFVRIVGVDKKGVSRNQLLDCSFNIKQKPAEGDLVAYFRFKDIHNKNIIHTDPNGMSYVQHSLEKPEEADANTFFERNVVPAGTGAFIQDEGIDRSKADITRISAFFATPRGVTTMEEGSLVFPLTVSGISNTKHQEQEQEQGKKEEEFKQYDMNRGYQHISLSIQRSHDGIFNINEKV